MIEFKNVTKNNDNNDIDNVSTSIDTGEFVFIMNYLRVNNSVLG